MSRLSLVRRRLLDPRPLDQAAADPLADAVNIPAAELYSRTHELPPRRAIIPIANTGDDALAAIDTLAQIGRSGTLDTDFLRAADPGSLGRLWSPAAFLEEVAPSLCHGRALDLACGSGRESVYLASLGFDVLGVDILDDALTKARDLASRCAAALGPLEFDVLDLESPRVGFEQPFDLIVGFRYLHRPLFAKLAEWLAPGGTLIYETFTELHRARHGKPSRDAFVLKPGELRELASGLSIAHYVENWHDGYHTARLIARRTVA